MAKPREWLVMPGWNKLNVENTSGQMFILREVVPDTVTITKEQLEAAFEKASRREWSHDFVSYEKLEDALFGSTQSREANSQEK